MIWMDRARARAQVGVGPTASKSPAQPAVWIHAFVGEFQLGLSLVRLCATGVLWGFRLSVGRGVRKRRQERQGQACVVVNRSVTCFYAIHAASSDGACADVPRRTLARFRRTTSRAQPAAGGGAAQNAMIELLVITDSVIIYILVIGDSVPFPYIHERSLNRTWLPMH